LNAGKNKKPLRAAPLQRQEIISQPDYIKEREEKQYQDENGD
jgi:hypothetical protein